MDESVQQGPPSKPYVPEEADTIGKIVEILGRDTYLNDEVFVELPDGTYRKVEAISTSDDTYVLLLSKYSAEPYWHED